MHAQTTATAVTRSSLQPAGCMPAGQPFMRVSSRSEVLARLSYADATANDDSDSVWAVVLNVTPHSPGFAPGQLVKLRGTELVRRIYEARPALYTLEQ
ncbi:hypothetical protein [Dyella sp. 20L07]|uniref:hypothetical protein n=1 Tax=Dyella sp. 20L07 TaxID=3384240 RepID=UPI003D290553